MLGMFPCYPLIVSTPGPFSNKIYHFSPNYEIPIFTIFHGSINLYYRYLFTRGVYCYQIPEVPWVS